ncbi:hypothetical protein QYF36_019466 [Acer negundo]|nr:hypothetical protein QYF36_019466 [Acer negundo]
MGRLDQEVINLKAKLQEAKTRFAELHETSPRMAVEGVIRECVEWGRSRTFFSGRLLRRMGKKKPKRRNEGKKGKRKRKRKKKITTSSYYTSKQGVCIASQNTQMRYSIAGIATTDQRMH